MQQHQQPNYSSSGSSPFQPAATSAALDALNDNSQPFLDGFAAELLQGQGSLPLGDDLFAGLPQPPFPPSPHAPPPLSSIHYGQVWMHLRFKGACRSSVLRAHRASTHLLRGSEPTAQHLP